ncbi:MAG: cytochrome P450 [Myxococcota bacterium]
MADAKRTLHVSHGDHVERVAWYPGGGPGPIERAVRAVFGLPDDAPVVLRDTDGDVVALSDALPDGLRLRIDGEPPARPAIPGPSPYPLVGNLPQVSGGEDLLAQAEALARTHGPYYRLRLPGTTLYICSDPDIVRELVARPEDFPKLVAGHRNPLADLRAHTVGQGLFTADDTDEVWHVAHRVLLPALGAQSLRGYFPAMLDVTEDVVAVLDAKGPDAPVPATDLMTRATFETIASTAFGTRFGAVTADEPVPFLQAMIEVLTDAMSVSTAILPRSFKPLARWKRERADAVMRETVDGIIATRRDAMERGEPVPNDLLQAMLASRDRATGKTLPDENIRHQLLTFLIAGHETTAGALSYALYYLATHPEAEARLVAEVDDVLGRDFSRVPTVRDVERLDYTLRVMKEALRLNPTAPAFSRVAVRDTVIAGKWPIARGEKVIVLLRGLHSNAAHWGEDADRFEPDRFLPAAVEARHPNAYHPFGLGMRSCIGFQFALLEARLILARIYQRYLPRLADPAYTLAHVPTLTVKPRDLLLRFTRRSEAPGLRAVADREAESAPPAPSAGGGLLVLYGTSMGAAQGLAEEIARRARAGGGEVALAEMDAYVGRLAGTVIVVCSTYNGQPPDNARRFAAWLAEAAPGSLKGVRVAVLGCGNRLWRGTYQQFPRAVHEGLERLGATPLAARGECDADGDFDGSFEAWVATLWPALDREPEGSPAVEEPRYAVEVVNYAGAADLATLPCTCPVHHGSRITHVVANEELQAAGSPRSTRHVEVALPDGVAYVAGDHLGVFPENPPVAVEEAARRIGLRPDDVVVLHARAGGPGAEEGSLPTGVPVTVRDLLTHRVDLLGPVGRREIKALAAASPCPPERRHLEALAGEDAYPAEVLGKRLTVLDLLARFPSVACDLAMLLSLRPVLRPRFYSISSSPRVSERTCTLTVAVQASVDDEGRVREGVCSAFLARQSAGARLRVVVRDNGSRFRLPADPLADVVLVGAGTGLAPLRAFLQERDAWRREGGAIGRAFLFFGCRAPGLDYLYAGELSALVEAGTLTGLYPAFSRDPDGPRAYVQDRLRERGAEVWDALDRGGSFLVCGDARRMAPAVAEALEDVFVEVGRLTPEAARARLDTLQAEGRYLQDVWSR